MQDSLLPYSNPMGSSIPQAISWAVSTQSAILGHPFQDAELQNTKAKPWDVEQNGGGQQPCPFQMVQV